MATINGASVFQESNMESNTRYDVLGKNSEVIAAGDPLTVASGVIKVAGTTDSITGVATKTQTMTSTNQTVALVYPGFVPALDQIFLMGTNADLTGNATDHGTYYKLTAATSGAVQVDVTSGVQTTTARVVEIVKVDPNGVGGTGSGSGLRQALVRFVKTPYTDVSITA